MNILKSSLFLGLFLLLFSCNSTEKEDLNIPCTGDCLFTMVKADGKMIYMDCFQKFAIEAKDANDKSITLWGIPNEVKEEFQVEGTEVKFNAIFKENTLQPSFPDPSFDMGKIYQIELLSIE